MPKKPLIATLPEYLREVLRISELFRAAAGKAYQPDGPWFRGVNDQKFQLKPGSYWRESVDEEALVVDFVAQAPPFFDSSRSPLPEAPWDWYFLMQHYGLPTRLLDWTENALVGLFFALQPRGPRPCVWILEPARFNKIMIADPHVITPGGNFSRHWLPFASQDQKAGCRLYKSSRFIYGGQSSTNKKPMAIYAARRNARIIAQQGVFTVHGANPKPLEELLKGHKSVLSHINIDPDASATLLEQLEICGISELRLFPELDKLAPALKRRFELV